MRKHFIIGSIGLVFAVTAFAKLPDPTPEQRAAAALAAAKSAHTAKVDAYDTCMSQARIADAYIKEQRAKGKVYTPEATPACANPGAFVPPPAAPVATAAPAQPATPAAPAPAAPAQPAAAAPKK